MKVSIIGLGYVGAVSAAWLASRGNDVWGVDEDPLKAEILKGYGRYNILDLPRQSKLFRCGNPLTVMQSDVANADGGVTVYGQF